MATQKEVADRAGVAPITVSRVVNGLGTVTEETRLRVEAAIRELRYYPNRQAQALASGLLRTIALVTPGMSEVLLSNNTYILQLLSGVVSQGRAHGLDVLLTTDFDHKREFDYLRVWHQRKVDGLVFVGLSRFSDQLLAEIHQRQIPCVSVSERSPALSWVDTDNLRAVQEAIQRFLDRGHRHFAFIGETPEEDFNPNFADRLAGTQEALENARRGGMDVTLEILPPVSGDPQCNALIARKYLSLNPRPTAILSANDVHALAFLRETRKAGLRCPRDFSIVGFDADPEGRLSRPTLASFAQPLVEMGKTAVNTIFTALATGQQTQMTKVFPLQFVNGGSLGPVPTTAGR